MIRDRCMLLNKYLRAPAAKLRVDRLELLPVLRPGFDECIRHLVRHMRGDGHDNRVLPKWRVLLQSSWPGRADLHLTTRHDPLRHPDSFWVLANREEPNPHFRISLGDDSHSHSSSAGSIRSSLHDRANSAYHFGYGDCRDVL